VVFLAPATGYPQEAGAIFPSLRSCVPFNDGAGGLRFIEELEHISD
jgi:hypothetical protein